ncbi:MAG: fasciclin domain-containing protein [Bacteroidales bacterium]|nr:fasciclin domain-containing protein [Bacteroidales bacterium]
MKKSVWRILTRGIQLSLFSLVLFCCNEDPVLWEVDSSEQVIADYIASNPEFSEFEKILEATGLSSLLSVRGPFTLFLPSNTEMEAYYAEKGVASWLDFTDPEFLNNLALNHLVPSKMESGDFGLGAIRDLNALGDYLVTEFDGADIILNKYSKIIDRDIPAANGVIHLIDKVIDPVTVSVYELIAGNPSYSLFTEGLKQTKLKDTLNVIDFPYGNRLARTRFTVLAVADTTFNRYGITTIDELISYFTNAPDSIIFIENGFYRYMEYHCLGGTFYLNDFDLGTRVYPILSFDNNISIRVDDDYKLNSKSSTEYTGFIIDESNYPAKNGTVHTINDLLPVFEPDPSVIVFETTDYFDMRQGDYFGKYYSRWFDGQNTFAYIKWEGDYLLYYFKDHDTGKLLNDDCLSMSGWWWVEITTPKIMKGKYNITSNLWANQTNYAVYVDGVNTALVKSTDPAESTSWGGFDWTKTERHTIKVVTLSPGLLFWDTVIFTPVN